MALPGQSLAAFEKERKGLQLTGGLISPGIPRGYAFQIYEDHQGKEYIYGKNLLPCDPTDRTGFAYVPKTTLIVLRDPHGKRIVVGDLHATLVHDEDEVQAKLMREEHVLASLQPPARTWRAKLTVWWRRQVLGTPYFKKVYDDGQSTIYAATARDGTLGELVLAPELDVQAPAGAGQPATPVADQLPATFKVVRYLTRYERPALEDLTAFITKAPSHHK